MSTITFRDKVADHFKSHANTWITAQTLMQIGGQMAWRSRVSDCRTDLKMQIDNRQRTVREHAKDCPAVQAWDIERACNCGRPRRYVVSEYRFTPPLDVLQAQALLQDQGAA